MPFSHQIVGGVINPPFYTLSYTRQSRQNLQREARWAGIQCGRRQISDAVERQFLRPKFNVSTLPGQDKEPAGPRTLSPHHTFPVSASRNAPKPGPDSGI